MSNIEVALILNNIRSAENVGSIFRTADAIGVSKIYLTGYTPSPIDRFGMVNKKIAKSALGAEHNISFEKEKSVTKIVNDLKRRGFSIVAIEQHKNSIDYRKFKLRSSTAFVFGNEVSGVEKSLLKLCDSVCEIPMMGKKESLNVSVSVGVALFRILDI